MAERRGPKRATTAGSKPVAPVTPVRRSTSATSDTVETPQDAERVLPIIPRWFGVLAVAAPCLYLFWMMLQPFINVILWAAVLVLIFMPVRQWLMARTGRPGLSAAVTTLAAVVMVMIPFLLIASILAGQVAEVGPHVASAIKEIEQSPVIGEKVRLAEERLGQVVNFEEFLKSVSQRVIRATAGLVGRILDLAFSTLFVLLTAYYLFRDADKMHGLFIRYLPLGPAQNARLIERVREIFYASAYGVLAIATIQGALGGLIFYLLGLPSALTWGVVMTLLSTIPLAGAFIVWVPVAVYLALIGAYAHAIILTAWGVFIIGLADNLLRPRLVGQRAQLHELVIFFSVLGGLQVFGMLGVLLGPIVFAVTLALVETLREGVDTGDGKEA